MTKAEGLYEDQAEVEAFLSNPGSYPVRPEQVRRIETHAAIVFLAGNEAWKIKRAVRFPYLDFSTLAKRRAVCQREVEVNRTWAPDLYLGCVPITRQPDGRLAIGGNGEPVEWAVHMRCFGQDSLLGQIAEHDGVSAALSRDLADAAFDSHVRAERIIGKDGSARAGRLVESLSRNIAELTPILPQQEARLFAERARRQHARVSHLLDARAAEGFVRRCHGDLHLGNIVLWQGRPMLFDAIEFDEEIARIDVLYDLAFLLMDLDHRGLRPAANAVLNRYLWRSGQLQDLDGLAALPLFLALRAGVRSMVAAERAQQSDADTDRAAARSYLQAALDDLDPAAPRLIAIAGLSGTGKSTLAARLAPDLGPAPGAVHLRSDLERKSLFGVGETDRLGPEAYTVEAAAAVYRLLIDKARHAAAAGQSVIVDAVFARADERHSLGDLAAELGIPLRGLWLTAPSETLMERVAGRRNDASDATVDVVRIQLDYRIGALGPAWTVIDAGQSIGTTVDRARAALKV